jgi:hypothetical protein
MMLAPVSVRRLKMRSGTSANFERHDQKRGPDQLEDDLRRAPADRVRARESEDEQHQPGRDEQRANRVEPPRHPLRVALAHDPRHEQQGDEPDRDVHEEDPLPAEVRREDAAEDHADRRSRPGDRAQHAERLVPLGAFREGHARNREDRWRQDRARSALRHANRDQHPRRGGEACKQRREREQGEPDHEHPPPAEDVTRAAAEKQEAAEGQGVAADDPLQVLRGGEVEILLDRGQRDIHDRNVEHDHQVGDAQNGERLPSARIGPGYCGRHESPS